MSSSGLAAGGRGRRRADGDLRVRGEHVEHADGQRAPHDRPRDRRVRVLRLAAERSRPTRSRRSRGFRAPCRPRRPGTTTPSASRTAPDPRRSGPAQTSAEISSTRMIVDRDQLEHQRDPRRQPDAADREQRRESAEHDREPDAASRGRAAGTPSSVRNWLMYDTRPPSEPAAMPKHPMISVDAGQVGADGPEALRRRRCRATRPRRACGRTPRRSSRRRG